QLAGTYHCAAAGETSWHGYARFVLGRALAAGRALKVNPDAVEAIPTSAYPTPAKRPLNSRLDTTKLQRSFGLHLPPWQRGVQRMLAEALAPTA
ncbi:MAG: sugar nucleotide-binding protein, partial [Rubrivivax sp.]|nr:sugar nucleotide-binding protein [Rubrivivax sp.]